MDSNLNNFIKDSISLINEKSTREVLKNSPDNPCIIIFLDTYSVTFNQVIFDKMSEHWGNKANYISQFLYDGNNDCFFEPSGDGSFSTKSDIYDLIEKVRDNGDDIFSSPDEIKLFFVLSTNNIDKIEYFKKLFECINVFKSIDEVNFLTMFFLMETTSLRPERVKLKDEIRREICESSIGKKYNSIFILSNLLSSGATLRGDKEAQNYSLLANIIVLSNNNDFSSGVRKRNLYFIPSDKYVALTASYLLVEKPVKEIVIISYYHILKYITDELFELKQDYRIPQSDLVATLKINNAAGFEFVNSKLEHIIKEYLPNISTIKMLPNMKQNAVSIKPESGEMLVKDTVFSKLNEITLGAWSKFYEENFVSVIKDKVNDEFKEDVRCWINKSLSEHFNYAELSYLMESGIEYLLESNKPEPRRTRAIESYEELYSFIIDTIKSELYDELKPIFIEVIRDVDRKSEKCMSTFDTFKHELLNLYNDYNNSDQKSISDFYGAIVRNYVNSSEISKKIRAEFKGFELTKSELQGKLYELFMNMVDASPEFKYSFEEELNKRLAATGDLRADKIISATLKSDDDKIIRLKSPTRPSFVKEFYLAKKDSDYMQLIATDDNTILDTASRKSAENIRLYLCEYGHLIRE